MGTQKLGRLALTIMATTGTLAGVLVGVAAPAMAAEAAVTGKVRTGGLALNVRAGPSTATERTATLKPGTKVTIECQQVGQKVSGAVRTTKLWDRLTDGTFVSDAYVARPKAAPPRCDQMIGQVLPPSTHAPPAAPLSASGWVAPIPGAVGSGFRTKARPTHDGVDIGAKRNTPILATAKGIVIVSECNASTNNCDKDGSPKITGCGWYVDIVHAGEVVTRYCHMVKKPSVKVGAKVKAGQVIGYVGTSGNSSGPHLHFEVHTAVPPAIRRNPVEPTTFLKARGIVLR
jgi:murein DD-endopeptidase MepM/ murein hydrolase activator NlpD